MLITVAFLKGLRKLTIRSRVKRDVLQKLEYINLTNNLPLTILDTVSFNGMESIQIVAYSQLSTVRELKSSRVNCCHSKCSYNNEELQENIVIEGLIDLYQRMIESTTRKASQCSDIAILCRNTACWKVSNQKRKPSKTTTTAKRVFRM